VTPSPARAIVAVVGLAAAAVTMSAAGVGAASAQATHADRPPDIVLIVTDDQRWDTLWAMPTVTERLAAPGVGFSNAFVVNPLCCPSRASILTGNYSHTHLVYRQDPPFGRFDWFDDSSTLATWLHDAGYRTGLFGKYIDGGQHAAVTGYVPPGWDRWVAFVHAEMYDYALTVDGTVRRYGSSPDEHSTEVLAAEAVAFLRDTDGPLFMVYAPAVPHAPAVPSPGDEEAFAALAPARPDSFDEPDVDDKPAWVRALPRLSGEEEQAIDAFRREQYRSLLGVDRAVGEIVDALAASGRLENALIVYTSDNGILHGEHRWRKKEAPYEEAIRVPLVLRWDEAAWSPRTEAALALNIDLAPTIADAAGVATPATDGQSLVPVLEDPGSAWRREFLIEHLEGTNPVTTYCAVRSARWKYVRYATGEEELYDLEADPFELENVASDASAGPTLTRLRERLRELCVPSPPGFADRSETRVPLIVGAIAALVILEVVATRDRRRTPGIRETGR
jgi:N-acetylglucosamine-6-sulfatase